MSLPPSGMQAVSDKTATRPRFTKRDWVRIGVLMLFLSAGYLAIDIVLDPALLPHAARAGRLPVLLMSVGAGFLVSVGAVWEQYTKRSRVEKALNVLAGLLSSPAFPIWSIIWIEAHVPNVQAARIGATGFGLLLIGLVLCIPSLAYGLQMARQRNAATDSVSGAHSDLQIVGLRPATWIIASAWSFLLVAAITYAMWSTLTSSALDSGLFVPLTIFASAFIIVMVTFFWLWFRARRYARLTGDAVLLFSTGQFSSTRAAPQRVEIPPNERPRWGVSLLMAFGLFAFSVLTFAVLDLYYIQATTPDGTPNWVVATLFPVFSWAGLLRASARCYQPTRFWRLLVAAAAFVVAGDAMWIDSMHPHHSIVPPLGLLGIAVFCSTFGVVICCSLLLHPMWEVRTEPNVAMPPDSALAHEATVAGVQRRPRFAPYLLLLQPVLIAAVHLIYYYGDMATIKEWGAGALMVAVFSMTFALATVVSTDLPQRQSTPPAKKAE